VGSVVPPIDPRQDEGIRRYLELAPFFVVPGIKTGMPLRVDAPQELGADRLCDAVAAFAAYGGPCLVLDFGTAVTWEVVSATGEYLGGAIVPGIQVSLDALIQRTAKLPRVEIAWPDKVVGRNTVQSIQSGILHGYVALVDGLLEKIRDELDYPAKVLATGGLGRTMATQSRHIEEVDPLLTLAGLKILSDRAGKR